ncbi:hypothetical protein Avbf_08798 [Armadillidium vulgare]|nr:hypothetical protein Avbf_08798 [Armadillidium vulgare]
MKDLLGTSRGRCKVCECPDYSKLNNLNHVCDFCGHYPTKHNTISDLSNETFCTTIAASSGEAIQTSTLLNKSEHSVDSELTYTPLQCASAVADHLKECSNVSAEVIENSRPSQTEINDLPAHQDFTSHPVVSKNPELQDSVLGQVETSNVSKMTQPPVLKGMELVRAVKLSKLIREEEYNILPEFLMSPDAILKYVK